MDPAQYLARRANLDDLAGLKLLWQRTGLQVLDMEKRLTEFQLVHSTEGDLAVAVGVRVAGQDGLLHNESFARPEDEDEFRQLLWDRVQTLARNHSLVRLWTQEDAPFWHQVAGFRDVEPEDLKKLPAAFGDPHHRWKLVRLHHDHPQGISVEKELELFQQASRASLARVTGQTRQLRWVAYAVGLIVFFLVFGVGLYIAFRGYLRRPPGPAQP